MSTLTEIEEPRVIERRRFIRDAAIIGWSAPLIVTLAANRAGASTCKPNSMACDSCGDLPCCSGCCCSDFDIDCTGGTGIENTCQAEATCLGANYCCYDEEGFEEVCPAGVDADSTDSSRSGRRRKVRG